MNAREVEMAVADYFCWRRNVIVPNVAWGMFVGRELDLVVLRPSGYCDEVEIKVSAADVVADTKKRSPHGGRLIRRVWFALPAALSSHPAIPAAAGILAVIERQHWQTGVHRIEVKRSAKLNKDAVPLNPRERETLLRLGCMRIWTLKKHLQRLQSRP